jgi:DNA/RNA-binding domain of Phe-tRNA-synthetase-like protein
MAAMVLYGRRPLLQDEPVNFQHDFAIRRDFPQLVAGVLVVSGVTVSAEVALDSLLETARARLASTTESAFPEIQAWRRVFAAMGLKPTQYRCAAESLLRRFRREGLLPRVHPLVDLCNAVSLAYAIPIAALDVAKVTGDLEVRYATGKEEYLTFGGEIEHPEPGEVVFADDANRAHARRWTNRQSGYSAVRDTTTSVLIVAEAVHESAADDIARLVATITPVLAEAFGDVVVRHGAGGAGAH